MTPVIFGAALALMALDSSPVVVQGQPKPAATSSAKTSDADDPDKVICRKEAETGSRFEKRVCMTRAEWKHQQDETEVLERRLNQTATPMGGGGMSGH